MKIVVFGAGHFGVNYIKELGHHVVAVVEPNKDRVEFIKNAYRVPVFPDSIPTHISYDAAIIVTPPEEHVRLAKPLLEEGNFVLIEKPLATSVEEALQLRKYKNKLMSSYIYLHHPEILKLKSQIKEIDLNHIYTQRTNDGPVREWQDVVWDLGVHDISILNFLFGQTPHSVQVMSENRDWAALRMMYGLIETLTYVSWRGGPKVRRIELVPHEGERIVFDDLKIVLEVSPLRRMLDMFLSGEWDERGSFDFSLDVLSTLEACGKL